MRDNATILKKKVPREEGGGGGVTILGSTTFGERGGGRKALHIMKRSRHRCHRRVQESSCMAGRHPPAAGGWEWRG